MAMLQDVHIHLQDSPEETDKILSEAAARNLGRLFCNSVSPENWPLLKRLADKDERIIPFYGVHPWYADRLESGWEDELKKFLSDERSCIGEIGLDRFRKEVDFDIQIDIFSRQLDIAVTLGKRFNVHCVRAWDTLLKELRARDKSLPAFIAHSFSGLPGIAIELIKYGAYISFSPRLSDPEAFRHRASFGQVPQDRILLETDYPYSVFPGLKNNKHPASEGYFDMIKFLYETAASLKGMSTDEMAGKVWENGTIFLRRTFDR